MSLGKLPGIKGLVSSSQPRRRFKSDLSVDMIGPPMGDFRHTMHVGRGGEVFGDTSFLSNYGGGGVREPGSPDSNSSRTGFFTRKFKHVRKNSGPRQRSGSRDLSSPPPDVSPIIKNAISLPQLNTVDAANGCFTSSLSSADDALCTYGFQSGFVTLPRLSRLERPGPDGESCRGSLPRSDSLTSFTLDLGPSLMTEVLSMIDIHSCLQATTNQSAAQTEGAGPEAAEDEEEEEDTETPVQSPGARSPDPCGSVYSRHMNSRGRCGGSDSELERGVVEREQAERFQRAAHVLSRHYGGASFTQRSRQSSSNSTMSPACNHGNTSPGYNNGYESPVFNHSNKSASSSEDDEEIKV